MDQARGAVASNPSPSSRSASGKGDAVEQRGEQDGHQEDARRETALERGAVEPEPEDHERRDREQRHRRERLERAQLDPKVLGEDRAEGPGLQLRPVYTERASPGERPAASPRRRLSRPRAARAPSRAGQPALEVVGHDHARHARGPPDQRLHRFDARRVQVRPRLVQKQQRRGVQDAAARRRPLDLAGGKGQDELIPPAFEPDDLEQLLDARVRLLQPVEPRVESECLAEGEVAVEQRVVAEVADPPPRAPRARSAAPLRAPAVRPPSAQRGRQHPQEGRLARAVRAQHDEGRARLERQRYLLERGLIAEVPADAMPSTAEPVSPAGGVAGSSPASRWTAVGAGTNANSPSNRTPRSSEPVCEADPRALDSPYEGDGLRSSTTAAFAAALLAGIPEPRPEPVREPVRAPLEPGNPEQSARPEPALWSAASSFRRMAATTSRGATGQAREPEHRPGGAGGRTT